MVGMAKSIWVQICYYISVTSSELSLSNSQYGKGPYLQREYMRPIGELSFHFMSRAPQPVQNYLTIISPCDNYVWALVGASVVAITLTLFIVDISYAKWTNTSMKGVFHHSMFNTYQMSIITSRQPKQFLCRNTETRPLQKAEILAKTHILAEIHCFGRNTLFRWKKMFLPLFFWMKCAALAD